MKRKIEIWLMLTGLVIFGGSVWLCYLRSYNVENVMKIIAFAAGFVFLAYKFLVGWLFINLTLKVEPERKSANSDSDHLSLKVILEKGGIDSLWLQDVQFRLSEMTGGAKGTYAAAPFDILSPMGMKKTDLALYERCDDEILWDGMKMSHYVLSPNESTSFSAYTTVQKGKVILVEAIVLGTRPFYGIQYSWRVPIQWRASLIVLPDKE